MEDGLQYDLERKGAGTRDGLPQPSPLRAANYQGVTDSAEAVSVSSGHGPVGSTARPEGFTRQSPLRL